MIDWIRSSLLEEAAINAEDVDLLRLTDDPAEACDIINAYAAQKRSQAAATAESTKPIEGSEVKQPAKPEQGES
jgi:predicted Rossmann-fold nucleotide-binding protein